MNRRRAVWPVAVALGLLAGARPAAARGGGGAFRMPFAQGVRPRVAANGGFGAPRPYGVHHGIDFAVPEGTPVFACRPGRVVVAHRFDLLRDWGRGYGGLIVIEHSDGSRSLYSHLSRVAVRAGERVGRRTRLGATGGEDNGESSGPHLHFMLFAPGGRPRDPLAVLRR